MKAFILAAGRGERMRPLTDHLPKPLLYLAGKPLIVHLIEKLSAAGVDEIIINTAYLGHMLQEKLGDGQAWGVNVSYSEEEEPLETGGAINRALDILGEDIFLLVNGDIWTDFDFCALQNKVNQTSAYKLHGAHLVLVRNPGHNTVGDFVLDNDKVGRRCNTIESYTFSGISLISPSFIACYPKKRRVFPLRETLFWGIEQDMVSGELHEGFWSDIGTPTRLTALEKQLAKRR